ncbi:MAG: hypothetical protein ISR59_01470 [Anaerolineales bacterium]|uniref:CarD-like/TRCF RNAP-interacting domain-containing protein n=1 Tax=Candidatus Desulfolinea nitratireducens TaxID=2841698 RepID=A0A8J6NHA6_9CHLR|nr:hypothetical protein [Candidatus Desulfolinea nitratireducens]MBL6959749.1 hypothetical protein [Anaerolineales bacterium]
MAKDTLHEGDWIVHKQHGVGQIRGIEKKSIGGDAQDYFRVEITGGEYWLPTNPIPDYVRSVASLYILRKVMNLIRKPPQDLPKDYKENDREVAARLADATLESNGELIRDLFARRHDDQKRMSAFSDRYLTELSKQFVREMVIVLGVEKEVGKKKLNLALQESLSKK